MSEYYDGTKLLSLLDLSGKKPEIYMCTSNRSAGKTTYFSRLLVNRFIDKGDKFCLIYRFNYELESCADKFFKDIGALFFRGHEMDSKSRARGVYHELFLDDEPCGYAISLNAADNLKKYSHLLSDVQRMFFDEFQSESDKYCPNEIGKFISVHTSIARGHGQQYRYVPVYMCSNPVSLLNPYYTEMGIAERLNDSVKFLRGDGFVLEQGFSEPASNAQSEGGFNRAFSRNKYVAYSTQAVYLNDNKAFIERPKGKPHYLATIKYNDAYYAVKDFEDLGIIYCDDKPDMSNPNRISLTTEDHEINYVMLERNSFFIAQLRRFFQLGCFRFKNLACKEAILKALSY